MKESFYRQYRPFSAKARSKLCNIQSETGALKALESAMNKNQVSAMDEKGRRDLLIGIQTNFSKNEVKILQNTELNRGTEGIRENLSENEVSAMDVNGKIKLPLVLQTFSAITRQYYAN